MLFVKPSGFTLPSKYFNSLKFRNPHGLAIYNKNTGKLYKTLNYEKGAEYLKKNHDSELVIHFRYSTSGAKTKHQLHGFNVCNDEYLLFHNGMMNTFTGDSWKAKNPRSDTEVFAYLFKHEPIERMVAYLEKYEKGSRFLIVNKKTKEYIIPKCANWNGDVDIEGTKINFSNSYAIDSYLLNGGKSSSWWNDYDDYAYGYAYGGRYKRGYSNVVTKSNTTTSSCAIGEKKDEAFYETLFKESDVNIQIQMLDFLWSGDFEEFDKLVKKYPNIKIDHLVSHTAKQTA